MATNIVVVVAIDDGPQSLAAFQRALKVFSKDSTHFLLVHVKPDHSRQYKIDQILFDKDWTDVENKRKELSAKVIEFFNGKAVEAGIKHKAIEIEGDPKEQLCNFCAERKADVLVLGAHSTNSIDRVLTGADQVTQHCLYHAPCAVMVERVVAHHPKK